MQRDMKFNHNKFKNRKIRGEKQGKADVNQMNKRWETAHNYTYHLH
jgi:hypothetical protein